MNYKESVQRRNQTARDAAARGDHLCPFWSRSVSFDSAVFTYKCDVNCLNWMLSAVCSYTLAVVQLNNDLMSFLQWYSTMPNITCLAMSGLPSGQGRKGGVAKRTRDRQVARVISSTTYFSTRTCSRFIINYNSNCCSLFRCCTNSDFSLSVGVPFICSWTDQCTLSVISWAYSDQCKSDCTAEYMLHSA